MFWCFGDFLFFLSFWKPMCGGSGAPVGLPPLNNKTWLITRAGSLPSDSLCRKSPNTFNSNLSSHIWNKERAVTSAPLLCFLMISRDKRCLYESSSALSRSLADLICPLCVWLGAVLFGHGARLSSVVWDSVWLCDWRAAATSGSFKTWRELVHAAEQTLMGDEAVFMWLDSQRGSQQAFRRLLSFRDKELVSDFLFAFVLVWDWEGNTQTQPHCASGLFNSTRTSQLTLYSPCEHQ